MLVNADLHTHSCFSAATSKDMVINNIAPKSREKGLNLVGTGDAFHPKWLDIIAESTEYKGDGIYSHKDCDFILTTEVEAQHKIHHVIILPNIEVARELSEKLVSPNKYIDGRPRSPLSGAELLELVKEYDCMIGPAHSFTPWTGMYKTYDSIYDCYEKAPDFVELGLSADTDMADTVKELADFVFLTNSDAHSPWPHRLGREFNQIEMEDISYTSLQKALKHKSVKANYGLLPNLGKYHMTACTKCYKIIDPELAKANGMRCSCGGRVKKGVDFRISEIADYKMIYDKGITTKTVQGVWQKLIDAYGPEIDVLINVPLEDISKIDDKVALGIEGFRNKTLNVVPGGGGKYGEISFKDDFKKQEKKEKVVTLDYF